MTWICFRPTSDLCIEDHELGSNSIEKHSAKDEVKMEEFNLEG